MYSLPSTSIRRAPEPRAKNSGSPPTALKARTGELTPPGISWRALSNRLRDSVPIDGRGPRVRIDAAGGGSPREQARRLLGEIGDDQIGAGAADGVERFEHDPLAIDPAAARGGRQHGVFARNVIGGDRHVDRLTHPVDDIEIGKRRLDHHEVGPLLDV